MKLLFDLRNEPSRNAKMDILTQANYLDQKVFEYAYNPEKIYRLANIPVSDTPDNIGEPTPGLFELLDRILSGEIKGNEARDLVLNFCDSSGDLIRYICTKDVRCGITVTTLNKVFGNSFIPQFKVQLAKTVNLSTIKYPCIAQIKYDGVRVITVKEKYKVTFRTRNGKRFKYPALETFLLENHGAEEFVLDGELTYGVGHSEHRLSISGLLISAIAGTPLVSDDLCYNIFDCLELTELKEQLCYRTYKQRYSYLLHIFTPNFDNETATIGPLANTNNIIQITGYFDINSEQEANEKYAFVLNEGWEGLVLKHWTHLYTFKRSKDWMKLKAIKDADLFCTGVFLGKGKFEGQIGGLICQGVVEGKFIDVRVGSGLCDWDRRQPQSIYIGKTIEVLYNSITQNAITEEYSLFLPRFSRIRLDK